jgi:hypothetical protein
MDNQAHDYDFFYRNALKKAALPFREDPSLKSPILERLPLGSCVPGVRRLVSKQGNLWAHCMIPSRDEPLWAVERNAKDGSPILLRVRPPSDDCEIVYRVVHNGSLPVQSEPSFASPSRELLDFSEGDIFVCNCRRLNSRNEMWVGFKHHRFGQVWVPESIGGVANSIEEISDVDVDSHDTPPELDFPAFASTAASAELPSDETDSLDDFGGVAIADQDANDILPPPLEKSHDVSAIGEKSIQDLLDALDAFAEEDARREVARQEQQKLRSQAILFADSEHLRATETPIITPAGGRFFGPLTATLEVDERDAQIFYTTDGSAPNPRYSLSEPLEIDIGLGVTHVKAIAVKPGMEPSAVVHVKFVIFGTARQVLKCSLRASHALQTARCTA